MAKLIVVTTQLRVVWWTSAELFKMGKSFCYRLNQVKLWKVTMRLLQKLNFFKRKRKAKEKIHLVSKIQI